LQVNERDFLPTDKEHPMITAYQSALGGLRAFGTKIQANSNNIANAQTDSFKKYQVTNSAVAPHGVTAEVSQASSPGPSVFRETAAGMDLVELSNVDLATELVDMNLNSTLYRANLKTLENVNEMTGMLLQVTS
jgi:flagellar basal body rod protein FlgG